MKYLKLLTILTLLLPVFSYADFQVNLKYGAKGDEVRELQEFLISEGHMTGNATGNFYSLTLKAVKEFQRVNNLPVTGYFGSMSRSVANQILAIDADNTELQELGSITAPVDTTLDKKIEDLNKKIDAQNGIIESQRQTQTQTNVILEQIKTNTNKVMPVEPIIIVKPDLSALEFSKKTWIEKDIENKDVIFVSYRFKAKDNEGEKVAKPDININAKLNGVEFENKTLSYEDEEYTPNKGSFLKNPGTYTFTFTYKGIAKTDEIIVN